MIFAEPVQGWLNACVVIVRSSSVTATQNQTLPKALIDDCIERMHAATYYGTPYHGSNLPPASDWPKRFGFGCAGPPPMDVARRPRAPAPLTSWLLRWRARAAGTPS